MHLLFDDTCFKAFFSSKFSVFNILLLKITVRHKDILAIEWELYNQGHKSRAKWDGDQFLYKSLSLFIVKKGLEIIDKTSRSNNIQIFVSTACFLSLSNFRSVLTSHFFLLSTIYTKLHRELISSDIFGTYVRRCISNMALGPFIPLLFRFSLTDEMWV